MKKQHATRLWTVLSVVTAAYFVIAGFFSLMLAYIGSKFVLEIILGRVH